MLYSGKVYYLQVLSYKESNQIMFWLDLHSFIVFFLRSNIDVVRDISKSLSEREVFPKGGVTRVSPGKKEQSL